MLDGRHVLAPGNGRSSEQRQVNRNIQVPGERAKAGDMIGMFMGDDDVVVVVEDCVDFGSGGMAASEDITEEGEEARWKM